MGIWFRNCLEIRSAYVDIALMMTRNCHSVFIWNLKINQNKLKYQLIARRDEVRWGDWYQYYQESKIELLDADFQKIATKNVQNVFHWFLRVLQISFIRLYIIFVRCQYFELITVNKKLEITTFQVILSLSTNVRLPNLNNGIDRQKPKRSLPQQVLQTLTLVRNYQQCTVVER